MNVADLIGILNTAPDSEKLKAIISFSKIPIRDKQQYEHLAGNLSSLLPSLWGDVIESSGKNFSSIKRLKLIHEKVFATAESLHTTGFLCPFFDAFEIYFPRIENELKKPESVGIKEKDVRRITYPEKYTYLLSKFSSNGRNQDLLSVQEVVHAPA